MTKRRIIVVESDYQAGSSLGLIDPSTLLERVDADNNPYHEEVSLTPPQTYLWGICEWARGEVSALAGKDDILLIVNGDMTQGNHFPSELSYGREEDQSAIAADIVAGWAKDKRVKKIRLTKSTGVHAFRENSADGGVVARLRLMFPRKDIRLVGHGQIDVGGVLIDYAHHGPGAGVRSWLKGNVLRYTVKSLQDTAIKDRRPVPDIVLRAHRHERVEEWVVVWRLDERIKTLGITTPSFQMLTEFARKVTNSEPKVTNGLVAIEVVGNKIIDVHWFAKTKYIPAQEEVR